MNTPTKPEATGSDTHAEDIAADMRAVASADLDELAQWVNPPVMDFGDALRAMKAGQRVARRGWNGNGMWIALTPGSSFAAAVAKKGHAAFHRAAEMHDPHETIQLAPHIDMRAADGTMVIGWLASQSDMLAEDWYVQGVEDPVDLPGHQGSDLSPGTDADIMPFDMLAFRRRVRAEYESNDGKTARAGTVYVAVASEDYDRFSDTLKPQQQFMSRALSERRIPNLMLDLTAVSPDPRLEPGQVEFRRVEG